MSVIVSCISILPNYRATIEDSTVYTRPWTIASTFVRGKRGLGEEY